MDQEKVKAVEKMKTPTNLNEARAVLALVGFHRKFISGFGKTSEPIYNLLKKEKQFVRTNE